MIFDIDGLTVYFPYDHVYPEQYAYMLELKRTLDAQGHCLLEMPSGTGKTVSLLSLITSYQLAHPEIGKLVYCTRTVPEIEKVMEELQGLINYREKHLPPERVAESRILGLALSSRRNMCIHKVVSQDTNRGVVDSKCRQITASWVRDAKARAEAPEAIEVCGYYEGFEGLGSDFKLESGVYSIEDMKAYGEERGLCPYFVSRNMLALANVVVYSYQYLIDSKVSQVVSRELAKMAKDSVVVFDEAHNIDDACIEALSVNIDRRTLEMSARNLNKLSSKIGEMKRSNQDDLQEEYQKLLDGLAAATGVESIADMPAAAPVLPDDAIEEVVPGNIRRAEHFVSFMHRFVDYLKGRLGIQTVLTQSPLAFLNGLNSETQIEAKPLRFCTDRLGSLMRTLEVADLSEFTALTLVADFATLVGTYSKGFCLIFEPYDDRYPSIPDPCLQFCCLDASLAIKHVFEKFRSVVITSGTLSPLELYPKILNFHPVTSMSFPMTLSRNCIAPLVVTRGSDQVAITSKFDARNDSAVVRNFGNLLVEMSACVPDGIVCFFPSYTYMESVVAEWHSMGIINQVLANKLLFIETVDPVETALALENYRRACENGRGAVLLSVARGKVSEGIDFKYHYGRCVILFGIPFVYTESRVLKARLEFLRETYQIREGDFLTFDAIRTAAQCMGRVIRSKRDYGLMILADKRYNRADKRNKLPRWIRQFLVDDFLNLSTDMAAQFARKFLREMAQPRYSESELGHTMWGLEHIEQYKQRLKSGPGGPRTEQAGTGDGDGDDDGDGGQPPVKRPRSEAVPPVTSVH